MMAIGLLVELKPISGKGYIYILPGYIAASKGCIKKFSDLIPQLPTAHGLFEYLDRNLLWLAICSLSQESFVHNSESSLPQRFGDINFQLLRWDEKLHPESAVLFAGYGEVAVVAALSVIGVDYEVTNVATALVAIMTARPTINR